MTPWTGDPQAPLSIGFSRQEYWSALPFPSPGDLPHVGIEPGSPALRADSLLTEPPGKRDGKESACNLGDLGLIPGLGRFPGGGRDNSERVKIKLNIMQIYALFFSIFFFMFVLSTWFCFLLDLYSLDN